MWDRCRVSLPFAIAIASLAILGAMWYFAIALAKVRNSEDDPPICLHLKPRNHGTQAEYDCPNCQFESECQYRDQL